MVAEVQVGIDIESIVRFKLGSESNFLNETFSEDELSYANESGCPEKHLCGFFCAKEAFLKASMKQNIKHRDIVVLHDKTGRPSLKLSNEVTWDRKCKISLSISHSGEYATAVVIISRNGKAE